jgi:hypothetical protein
VDPDTAVGRWIDNAPSGARRVDMEHFYLLPRER